MAATPPPELADHEKRITQLENTVNNLSCELQALRAHMDARFEQIEQEIRTLRIELRAEFEARLHEAIEKLNARMDSQYHMIVGLQVAILLALVALVAA